MNQLRKTTLGVAVATVIYGIGITGAQATTTTIGGNAVITNHIIEDITGDIHTFESGVTIQSSNNTTSALRVIAGDGTINNHGKIAATAAFLNGGGTITLNNSGYMTGTVSGGTGTLTLNNSGVFSGLISGTTTNINNTNSITLAGLSNLGSGYISTNDHTLTVNLVKSGNNFWGISTTGNFTANAGTVVKISINPNDLRGDPADIQAALATFGDITTTPYIINAAAGITGGAYTVTTDNILLNFVDVNKGDTGSGGTANQLKVVMNYKAVEQVTSELGYNDHAQKIAAKLQTGLTSADITELETAYGQLVQHLSSTEDLKAYLSKVLPDDSNAAVDSNIEMSNAVFGNISNRTSAIRTGQSTGDLKSIDGFWFQGLYAESDQDPDGTSQGYKGRLSGATLGVDREFDDITAGIALSYGKGTTNFKGNRTQKDESHAHILSVYSTWEKDNLYVDGSLSFGVTEHDTRQNIGTVAAESASYDSQQVSALLSAGYYMPTNILTFEPKVSSRINYLHIDSYTYQRDSTGENSGNSSSSTSMTRAELGLGAFISKTLTSENGTSLTPRAGIMFYQDMTDEKLDKDITFAGDDYTLKGSSPARNSKELSFDVDLQTSDNLTISASYVRVLKNDFDSKNYTLKLKYVF